MAATPWARGAADGVQPVPYVEPLRVVRRRLLGLVPTYDEADTPDVNKPSQE